MTNIYIFFNPVRRSTIFFQSFFLWKIKYRRFLSNANDDTKKKIIDPRYWEIKLHAILNLVIFYFYEAIKNCNEGSKIYVIKIENMCVETPMY